MSDPKLNYKMEQIKRFVVPNIPENGKPEKGEDPNATVYKLKCVDMRDQLVEKPCTADAWKMFNRYHPENKTKVSFYLKINDTGLVFDYSEVLTPPPAGMFKQEFEDGRVIESSDRLIFERKIGTKDFDPVFTPDMVQVATVESILAALNAAEELVAGEKVGGRYDVYEITQRMGKEVVVIDIGR